MKKKQLKGMVSEMEKVVTEMDMMENSDQN